MSHDEDTRRWIDEVISRIVGNLGADVSDVTYELSNSVKDNFISNMYKVCVEFVEGTKGERTRLPVVVKRRRYFENLERAIKIDNQFQNENLFYRLYARPNDNVPRYLYVDELVSSDLIVLEDMNAKGYHPCPYATNVPLEYTLTMMRELGRFHGKGYVMKELRRDEFLGVVNQLRPTRYCNSDENVFKTIINVMMSQAIEYLRSHGHDSDFCDRMDALFADAYSNVMLKLTEPLEPLSTLCHGDFTIHNALFKTVDENRYRMILIDFGCILHATPVVDLSTYICLNCSIEMTRERFPEIMRAYHDALREYLRDAGIWDDEKYSYDVFVKNYKWGGLFGFGIASFFLAYSNGFTMPPEMLNTMELQEYMKLMKQSCVNKLPKIMADMLLQMKEFGCLTDFLQRARV